MRLTPPANVSHEKMKGENALFYIRKDGKATGNVGKRRGDRGGYYRQSAPKEKHVGYVEYWNEEKSFGFLRPEGAPVNSEHSIYFNHNSIGDIGRPVNVSQRVEYEVNTYNSGRVVATYLRKLKAGELPKQNPWSEFEG